MKKQTIRLSIIESARQALEQAPEHQVNEVGKGEAIDALAETIRAAQKKGYSVSAIAELLTEHGIAITGIQLKGYLSRLPGGGSSRRKKRRKGTGTPPRESASTTTRESAVGPVMSSGISARATEDAGKVQKTETSGGSASPGGPAGVTPEKTARVSVSAGPNVPRQSAFVPRKDSDDI